MAEATAEAGRQTDDPVDAPVDAAVEARHASPSCAGRSRPRWPASCRRAGARYCFTVPGEAILPLLDDLAAEGIRVVTTRHEAGAAFMAEALAQSTGRPQLVAVSRTVGAANAAIGIHTASQDSAPLVVLVGQVERAHLGREAFQESGPRRRASAPWRRGRARWMTLTRSSPPWPGRAPAEQRPSWAHPAVAAPRTSWTSRSRSASAPARLPRAPAVRPPTGPPCDASSSSLAASERGVIVAGGGVLRARATKRLVALSEALAVPVIAAWRRPDVFPNDHPNYLGMAGPWAAPTVLRRLEDADVIVFIGARLSEMTTHRYVIPGPDTRWAHVDVQPRATAGLPAPDAQRRGRCLALPGRRLVRPARSRAGQRDAQPP